jgi:radical SAM protein with 4Fe4S-binding SPASM domain
MAIAMFSELPKLIEIEPTLTCNLRCKMCHVSYEATESRSTFPAELTEKLAGLGGVDILLGSNYEPTMNRGFPEIVRSLTRHGLRIELITNGTLLEGEALEALAEANIRLLVVSFDGARKETYERIRRRANYEKTLNRILAARERIASETLFALNSTIMRSNLEEIGDSVALWDRVGFDQIRFIAMVVRHPDMEPESLFSVRDRFHTNLDAAGEELIASRRRISMASSYFNTSPLRHKFPANVHGPIVSSGHPAMRPIPELRAEHQLGPGPGMTWPCRSPWTFARILPTGDVELCFKYIVGNLRRHSFKDIWFGSRAVAVRRRVAEDAGICPMCEHYRFCLKGGTVDTTQESSFTSEHLILCERIGRYNVVSWQKRYFVLPQGLGSGLEITSLTSLPGVIPAQTLESAREIAKSRQAGPRWRRAADIGTAVAVGELLRRSVWVRKRLRR